MRTAAAASAGLCVHDREENAWERLRPLDPRQGGGRKPEPLPDTGDSGSRLGDRTHASLRAPPLPAEGHEPPFFRDRRDVRQQGRRRIRRRIRSACHRPPGPAHAAHATGAGPGGHAARRASRPQAGARSRGIFRTILVAHYRLGLAGLGLGALLFVCLYLAGLEPVVLSPRLAAALIIGYGGVFGLMAGGLVSLRPDHTPYVAKVRTALDEGRCAIVVHAFDDSERDRAQEVLAAHGGETDPHAVAAGPRGSSCGGWATSADASARPAVTLCQRHAAGNPAAAAADADRRCARGHWTPRIQVASLRRCTSQQVATVSLTAYPRYWRPAGV